MFSNFPFQTICESCPRDHGSTIQNDEKKYQRKRSDDKKQLNLFLDVVSCSIVLMSFYDTMIFLEQTVRTIL
jgi:hypothetical protein